MRKDVRLGLAVGVVLFAIAIVYFIVASANSPSKTVAFTGGDPAAARKDVPRSPDIDDMGPRMTEVTPSTHPAETDHAAGDAAWNWGEALSTGREVTADVTRTPAIGSNPGESRIDTPAIDRNVDPAPPVDRTPVVDHTPAIDRVVDPAPATRQPGQRTHVVKEGENFWTIARSEYGNGAYFAHLQRANPKLDPRGLRPGMIIVVPEVSVNTPGGGVSSNPLPGPSTRPAPRVIDPAKQYVVLSGDTLYTISIKLWGKADRYTKLYELNKQVIGNDPNRLSLGMVLTLPDPPAK